MTNADFNYIRTLVRGESALTIEPGKEYFVESRLGPLARQEGFPTFEHMVIKLRGGPFGELHRKVVEALTNNETYFFRDVRVFAMLTRAILPALVTDRSKERTLSVWCAACSSGQEPYSLAMLFQEHRPSLAGWDIRIVASDISREMIARAKTGHYSQTEVNRGLPANLLLKYFKRQGLGWEIADTVRRMVDFREINLMQPRHDPGSMDLILMRNVLIYFELETKKAILQRARRLLAPRGYLLLGGAETTTNIDDSFESVSLEGAVCFRQREGRTATTRPH
jgi:chemotaxis protein methyltransferase CheR